MPSSYAVYGCTSSYTKKGNIAFHRLPKNDKIRRIWSHFCKRKDAVNADNALMCSLHFFYVSYVLRSRINQDGLEHYFACLRQMGIGHNNPSDLFVKYRIRAHLLGKVIALLAQVIIRR